MDDVLLQESERFALENPHLFEEPQYSEYTHKKYELINKLKNKEIHLSYSWLKEILKSPCYFLNYKLKDWKPPTESMTFGSLIDLLITQPSDFEKEFKVISKYPSKGNQEVFAEAIINGISIEEAFNIAYKKGNAEVIYNELKDYIEAIKLNITPITEEFYSKAKKVSDYLLSRKDVASLLDSCSVFQEKSILEYKGWKFTRIKDASSVGLTIDLKFMSRLNPDFIDREIFKMNYDLQAGLYTLDSLDDFFNICFDQNGNYLIVKYDESILQYGRKKIDYCLLKLKDCIKNNRWNESYNFHYQIDKKFDIRCKTIYKPTYAKGFNMDI